ncbi:MAG TPA: hypothetical protein VGL86_09530 [Polyangia bacterium]|jgi:hypothetical protein
MRKALALAAAVAAGALTSGCGAISFDVSQAVPEQQVPGSPLGGLLPSFLPQPFAITIDVQQETAKRSTGPASSANLKSVSFAITPHDAPSGNFDFVDEIHIFVAPSSSGSSLPMVEIANLAPVPKGQTTIDLTIVPKIDLLPYINAGASISASASGHSPPQTVTYDGTVVVTIHI